MNIKISRECILQRLCYLYLANFIFIVFIIMMVADISITGENLLTNPGFETDQNQNCFLAQDGKAMVNIVMNSADAIPAEKTAVKELAAYLEKITGAKFETVEEKDLSSTTPAIYVGNTRYAWVQGIDMAMLGSEESILRTVGKNLILTGGRPRGTIYAVYEILENTLGCRWYTPWSEKVPYIPTCKVPAMDLRVKPYFILRRHYNHVKSVEGWKMFNIRNRLPEGSIQDEAIGGGVKYYGGRISGGHGFHVYIPADKYFKDHPEYFSMRDGKRVPSNGQDGNHLCLTNPDVLRIIIEEVKKDVQEDPRGLCFTVAVNDGGCQTICDCPKCRDMAKQYGGTDQPHTDGGLMVWFVNQVADAIKDKYPDKYIRTLAYSAAAFPPKNIQARDNVIVDICLGARSEAVYLPLGVNSYELQNVRNWSEFTKHIWLWDYANPCYHFPSFFRPYTWKMDEQFKFFKKLSSIDGMFQDNSWAQDDSLFPQFYEMNMWIYAKLCKDPDKDVNVLIADFVNGYYGKAGSAVLKYIELIHKRLPKYSHRLFNYDFIRQAQGFFDEAEAAVKNDTDMLGRIKDLRIQLDLSTLAWRNTIIRDYLQKDGTLEQYPFRVTVLKSRLFETLKTTKHPYIMGTSPRYWIKGRKQEEPVMDIVHRYIEEISAGVEYTPLPKEFQTLPYDNVIDLTAPLIAGGFFPIVVPDSEATLGLAVPRMNADEIPMHIAVYSQDPNKPQSFVGPSTITAKDIQGDGYHLYRGPRFPLTEWTFVFLTNSWQIQEHLYMMFDPSNPLQKWDVYVSVKFTGPAYPFGNPKEPNGLFIDRMILVKVD